MKNKTNYTIPVMFCALLFSCQNKKDQVFNVSDHILSNINIKPSNTTIEFSDYFSGYNIYEIDNSEIITDISNVFKINDELLFRCHSIDYGIYKLNTIDNIITKTGKKGKGPSEYISIKHLDCFNNMFGILDFRNKRISHYDFASTSKINDSQLQSAYESFAYIDDNHIALYKDLLQIDDGRDEFKITIIDLRDIDPAKSFIKIDPVLCWERTKSKAGNFCHFYDTLIYSDIFSDTVYTVFKDKIQARYIFDLNNYKIPDNIFYDHNLNLSEFLDLCVNSNYIWGINNFHESNNFIFFNFIYTNHLYYAFYNKKDKTVKTGYNIHDNLLFSGAVPLFSNFTGIEAVGGNEKSLFFSVEPYFVIEKINEIKGNLTADEWLRLNANNDLLSLYKKAELSSNPIIIEYEFK